MDDVAMVG